MPSVLMLVVDHIAERVTSMQRPMSEPTTGTPLNLNIAGAVLRKSAGIYVERAGCILGNERSSRLLSLIRQITEPDNCEAARVRSYACIAEFSRSL